MIKTRLSPSMAKSLDSWEREIDRALTSGKGKYASWTFVKDLFDYKLIISLMRRGKLSTAASMAIELDTSPREEMPIKIYDYLYGVYNR